jgi:hypothetical protein
LACVSSLIQLVHVITHKAWVSNWPWRPTTTAIVLAGCIVVTVLVYVLTMLSIRLH